MPIRARLAAVGAVLLTVAALAAASRAAGTRVATPRIDQASPAGVAAAPTSTVVRHAGVPPTAAEASLLALLARQGIAAHEIGGTIWGSGFFSMVFGAPPAPEDGRWVRTDQGVLDAVFVGSRAATLRVCTEGEALMSLDGGGRVHMRYRVAAGRSPPRQRDMVIESTNHSMYFTVIGGTVIVTDSAPLNESLLKTRGATSAGGPC